MKTLPFPITIPDFCNAQQKQVLQRKITQYEAVPDKIVPGGRFMDNAVVAIWPFISLAIESDGYCHS